MVESQKIVWKETAVAAIGILAGSAIMVGVYALLDKFSLIVLWSALAGSGIMILNYFFMAVTASVAADRAQKGDAKSAQNMVQLSSVVRLLAMGGALLLGIRLGGNTIALVLPLTFARPTLMMAEFFRKKDDA